MKYDVADKDIRPTHLISGHIEAIGKICDRAQLLIGKVVSSEWGGGRGIHPS